MFSKCVTKFSGLLQMYAHMFHKNSLTPWYETCESTNYHKDKISVWLNLDIYIYIYSMRRSSNQCLISCKNVFILSVFRMNRDLESLENCGQPTSMLELPLIFL